jgi:hypothetical protein
VVIAQRGVAVLPEVREGGGRRLRGVKIEYGLDDPSRPLGQLVARTERRIEVFDLVDGGDTDSRDQNFQVLQLAAAPTGRP